MWVAFYSYATGHVEHRLVFVLYVGLPDSDPTTVEYLYKAVAAAGFKTDPHGWTPAVYLSDKFGRLVGFKLFNEGESIPTTVPDDAIYDVARWEKETIG